MTVLARARYAVRALRRPHGLGRIGDDEHDARDLDFELLGLASSALPADSFIVPHALETRYILDQLATQTCVAHAYAGALRDRSLALALAAGVPIDVLMDEPLVSRAFAYHHAVLLHGGPMVDAGTYLRTCAEALRRFGAPDEATWPFKSWDVVRQPTPVAYVRAHPRRLGDYHRIYDEGDALVLAARAALVAKHPVVFGVDIPASFTSDIGPTQMYLPSEPAAGGHAMRWTGYRTRPDGFVEFRTVNSWGRRWRDVGAFWMHEAWAKKARDRWIVRSLREVRGEV